MMHSLDWISQNATKKISGGGDSKKHECALDVGDVVCGKFTIDKVIKRNGGESSVYGCGNIAIKVFDDDCCFDREVLYADKFKNIGWPNEIVQILGFGFHFHNAGEMKVHNVTFLELAKFSLREVEKFVEKSPGPLPLTVSAGIHRQVLRGLEFFHKNGLVFGDLKGENLLVSSNHTPAEIFAGAVPEVKLCDFGWVDTGPDTTDGLIGTWEFTAPEGISDGEYSFPADIWAFGVTFLRITTGVYIFAIEAKDKPVYGETIDNFLKNWPRPDNESDDDDEIIKCRKFLAFLISAVIDTVTVTDEPEKKKGRVRYPKVPKIGLRKFLELNSRGWPIDEYMKILECCLAVNPAARKTAPELLELFSNM